MTLTATSAIAHGNACDITVVQTSEPPLVTFAADPHGGPETMWFCLRVARGAGKRDHRGRFKLVLKHSGNMLGGSDAPYIVPVARVDGGDWDRVQRGVPEALPDGRANVYWTLEEPRTFVDLALCYPYGREELDALLRDTRGFYEEHTIGVSQSARAMTRLSNSYGERGSSRPGIYLVARQHSGETPGSWVLDGFLRRVADIGRDAPLIWCVPLSNVDGVEQGDYGKDNFPYDLNRAWGSPPMRHEVSVMQRDMRRWKERCRPVLALDFHAPGMSEHDGVYTYLPNAAPSSGADRAAGAGNAAGTDKAPGAGGACDADKTPGANRVSGADNASFAGGASSAGKTPGTGGASSADGTPGAGGASSADGISGTGKTPGTGGASGADTSSEALARVRRWADAFEAGLTKEFAAANFARVVDYASRWETPNFTAFCVSSLDVPALSLETPYAATADGALFTRERYREIGRRLADTALKIGV